MPPSAKDAQRRLLVNRPARTYRHDFGSAGIRAIDDAMAPKAEAPQTGQLAFEGFPTSRVVEDELGFALEAGAKLGIKCKLARQDLHRRGEIRRGLRQAGAVRESRTAERRQLAVGHRLGARDRERRGERDRERRERRDDPIVHRAGAHGHHAASVARNVAGERHRVAVGAGGRHHQERPCLQQIA